jgi:glutamine synthetase
VDYYVKTKQAEFNEWHNEVTQWEIDRYLQLF